MKSLNEPSQPESAEDPDGDEGSEAGTSMSSHGAAGPQATAAYLADITSELSKMASGAGLDLLAYLLEMARLEATKSMRNFPPDRAAS